MSQLTALWAGFDIRQKLIIALASVGVFVAVLLFARLSFQSEQALLYSGLDPAAAGEVVAALEQQGVVHTVSGGAIYVAAADRDRLRVVLAGEGLPANGPAGYELLDQLTGFGTTSQMFDAAYWRAKEGELARTITAHPSVRAARVHIARGATSPFRRSSENAASISVTPAGSGLSPDQARALRFLVASAVADLSPEDVSVIDSARGVLLDANDTGAGYEGDQAEALRRNLMRLLEAQVGPGNAVVEVNIDRVTQNETLVERRFNPEERVIISTETTERTRADTSSGGGAVSVASNLPDGDAAAGNRQDNSNDSESRERVNYEVSETTREVLRTAGAIRRLSVAVLVNAPPGPDGIPVVRTAEELADLEQLVSSAMGFDAARGDSLTLRSMPLTPVEVAEGSDARDSSSFLAQIDPMSLIQALVVVLVAAMLILFVLKPLLRPAQFDPLRPVGALSGGQSSYATNTLGLQTTQSLAGPPPTPIQAIDADGLVGASQTGDPGSGVRTGSSSTPPPMSDEEIMPDLAIASFSFPDPEVEPLPDISEIPALSALAADQDSAEAVNRLRALIEDRKSEAVEVLRGWMSHPSASGEDAFE